MFLRCALEIAAVLSASCLLASCGLCERFTDSEDCGGSNPIGGTPADLTLLEADLADALVRPPRRCEDTVFEAHTFEVLAFGGEIAPRTWLGDELIPELHDRSLFPGWGLAGCDGSTTGVTVHDWGEAQEIAQTVLDLAELQDVSVSIAITVEEEPTYCAQPGHACEA